MAEPVLVADIGGTNARFALATKSDGKLCVHDIQNFRAEDFETLRDAADAYVEAVGEPKVACFAVAGPNTNPVIEFTNSRWVLDFKAMKEALNLDRLLIANDFEALAYGIPFLTADDFVSVKPGECDPKAPILVIGPGTGLGQALMVPEKSGVQIIPTEGGHVSFAPRTEKEIAVMNFIAREHPRVSVERLLSGRGFVNIHRALCAIAGTSRAPLTAQEITQAAISGEYPVAVDAVNMFCDALGRVAGDAALCCGARGGVILGGGILPKMQEFFLESGFVDRFLDKGRMQNYLEPVPVDLIIKEGTALWGAAAIMARAEYED